MIDKISAVNDAVPGNPYQGPIKLILGAVGGGILAGSTLLAKLKNSRAAASVLASALPDNLVQRAIESSPNPDIAAAVAAHLQAVPSSGTT